MPPHNIDTHMSNVMMRHRVTPITSVVSHSGMSAYKYALEDVEPRLNSLTIVVPIEKRRKKERHINA